MLPLLLTLTAQAEPAAPTGAIYGSVSTILYVPNALSVTIERDRPNPQFVLSAGAFGGLLPALLVVVPVAGISAGFHYLPGVGEHRFEAAVGGDVGVLFADGDTAILPFPTLFLGYRKQPEEAGRAVFRIGAELSQHSVLGLTVSVGGRT